MSRRSPWSFTFHLLLAVALVLPGIAAPALAATSHLNNVDQTHQVVKHATPCAGMAAAKPDAGHPSAPDGCASQHCSLSACLGTACLPEFVALVLPAARSVAPAQPPQVADRSRAPDLQLRPPIA